MNWSQIAMGNFTYYYYSFAYFLDAMEKQNIDRIELWLAEPHLCLDDCSYAGMRQFSKMLRERNFKVCCVTPEQYQYPVNIASSDADTRKRSTNYFKKAIDLAAELEAPKVLVASGQCPLEENREEAFKRMKEVLTELAHNACFKGVQIVFEPMPRKIDLVRSAAEVKKILDEVGFYEGIRGMMDFDICLRQKDTPKKYMEILGKKNINHIHLNDGNPGGHLIPGEGVLPIKEALEELESTGYTDDISVEVTNSIYYEAPDAATEKILQFLRGLKMFK